MRREGWDGEQGRRMWERQRRGIDERDKVSTRKSWADGRGAWRFTQKAQTGLIRNSSNPSMMLTGGQTRREKELRQAERLTKTSGLEAQRKKQRLHHHLRQTRIPFTKLQSDRSPDSHFCTLKAMSSS